MSNGASVEVAECPGIYVGLPQPVQEEELLSYCLGDGVFMVSSGQILTDVNPDRGDGAVSFSLWLPVVQNQLLRFAHVQIEVVVLVLRCQCSDLLSVLVPIGDQADDNHVISKLDGVVAPPDLA